ncbi:MAG: VIT1/CCC1 transporter family protein [Candidatus Kaiserbacteria bacterium]|nr:MAG: VIT1/CCC1 transporter family protein [Candidatus Kaiserbacteria bacterium]
MRLVPAHLRNFVFGVEDSLVSTVGLLSGIAIAGVERETIFLTGVVLVFVEAVSMAAGSFLSEVSAEEYEGGRGVGQRQSLFSGLIMFGSYLIAGFIPIFPYTFLEGTRAFASSIMLSVAALFVLGAWSGVLSRSGLIRGALRMAVVGGVAIAVGVGVGTFIS